MIQAKIQLWYQQVTTWWIAHVHLREQLKAARVYVAGRLLVARVYVIERIQMVVTGQIQSRAELQELSPYEIMCAYRSGRLKFLMHKDSRYSPGRDQTFRDWVKRGGQQRP